MTDPKPSAPGPDVGTLELHHFQPLVGDRFRVGLEGGEGPALELIEAEAAKGEHAGKAFSLLFRGPEAPFLEQRLYALDHAEMGGLALFLVPVGKEAEGYLYEAVFTRM